MQRYKLYLIIQILYANLYLFNYKTTMKPKKNKLLLVLCRSYFLLIELGNLVERTTLWARGLGVAIAEGDDGHDGLALRDIEHFA